jgi:hypothetical protein
VHFHFTPTRASWLNQIEIWFSILADQSLAGASFDSVAQLRAQIDAFIELYNEHAKPFAWTKSEVHQKRLKSAFRGPVIPGTRPSGVRGPVLFHREPCTGHLAWPPRGMVGPFAWIEPHIAERRLP